MKKELDLEYVKSLCFPYRDFESSDLVELKQEDLKYKVGDTFYLKPLEVILNHPVITRASIIEGYGSRGITVLEIEVAGDATVSIYLEHWNSPKVIDAQLLYNDLGVEQWYYTFGPSADAIGDSGWVEEWMIMEKPNKKLQALSVIKHLGGFNVQ